MDRPGENPLRVRFERLASPVGAILMATDEAGRLRLLEFEDHPDRVDRILRRHFGAHQRVEDGGPSAARRAVEAYFEGDHAAIGAVEVVTGGTAFQRKVWAALRDIPRGATEGYGALAARIGLPKAVRAVGMANGANPIGIVVPCHRVIGADGSLTGYGGGIERKRWLLAHEGAAFRAKRATAHARLPGL